MSDSYCPYCGSVIKPDDAFCNSCGANIDQQTNPASAGSQTYPPPPPPQQQQQYATQPQTHQYGASSQTVYQQPAKTSQDNALGIVSIISAIVGFCVSFLGFPFINSVLFIVGIVTGALGRKKSPENKTIATIGLVLSIIGLIGSLIFSILAIVFFAGQFIWFNI